MKENKGLALSALLGAALKGSSVSRASGGSAEAALECITAHLFLYPSCFLPLPSVAVYPKGTHSSVNLLHSKLSLSEPVSQGTQTETASQRNKSQSLRLQKSMLLTFPRDPPKCFRECPAQRKLGAPAPGHKNLLGFWCLGLQREGLIQG